MDIISKHGRVDGALKIFRSKERKDPSVVDYHQDVSGDLQRKWFIQEIFPNIPQGSVIVLDNASYHNVRVSGMVNICLTHLSTIFFLRNAVAKKPFCVKLSSIWG